jgi:formylglycine-generating enzyme required for sulfatase activity
MAGNLAEWVEDCWHDTYSGRPEGAGPWTLSAERNCERVIRGGSWAGDINNLRVASRVKLRDDRFGFNIGFRIARDLQ